MNEETYEALQEVVKMAYESGIQNGYPEKEKAIKQVEDWIDEVAKDYDGPTCSHYLPELVEDGRWTTVHCRHCFKRRWDGKWITAEQFAEIKSKVK